MLDLKTHSYLAELASNLRSDWPTLFRARETTGRRREELRALLAGEDSADANVVVYGSMARGEMTTDSDLDWTLLLDKPVDPADLGTTQRIASKIYRAKFAEPGKNQHFRVYDLQSFSGSRYWRAGRHEREYDAPGFASAGVVCSRESRGI